MIDQGETKFNKVYRRQCFCYNTPKSSQYRRGMKMDLSRNPVGVFDSGVGGISTLKEIIRELPEERLIYYGDMANAPYGTKSTKEVIRCVRGVVELLMAKQIKALVIACNTATGAAAATLRQELEIPVIGMEPALKPASEIRKDGSVLVMATPLTLRQEKFENLMKRYGEGAVKVPCPGLMELVEAEDTDGARRYLKELFSRFPIDRVDAVVLGCTHYVFLYDMIRDLLPERIAITDGNAGTARQLRRVLAANGLLNEKGPGSVTLETSGTDRDLSLMKKLLGDPLSGAAHGTGSD